MNLFTPIQIAKKDFFTQNYYNFDIFNNNLFEITRPHIESINDQKTKIIQWLKKMNCIEKMMTFTYTNKQFVCLFRTMYFKNMNQFLIHYDHITDEFDLQYGLIQKSLPKSYYEAEDNLLQNMQIMSRYTQFDSVTFKQQILNNIQKIFELFQIIGDTIIHAIDYDDYIRLKKQSNSCLFYDSKQGVFRKTIGIWIIQVLMMQISMRYFEYCQSEKTKLQQQKNQIRQMQKQYQRYWKNIQQQNKKAILNRVLKLQLYKMCEQHRMMVKVSKHGFPVISKNVKGSIRLMNEIMKCNQKDIYNLLVFTQLQDSLESYSYYKYHILLEIQNQIKKEKEVNIQKIMKKNKNKKKKNIQKLEKSHDIQPTNKPSKLQPDYLIKNQALEPLKSQKSNKTENHKNKQAQSKIQIKIQQSQQQSQPQIQIRNPVNQKINTKKKQKKQLKRLSSSSQLKNTNFGQEEERQQFDKNDVKSNKESDTTNDQYEVDSGVTSASESTQICQTFPSLNKNSNFEQEMPFLICQKQDKNYTLQVEDNPLQIILDSYQKTLKFYNKQRKIILNRINYMFIQLNLSFKVYGSCAYDVALPTSDIDIVVDPMIVNFFYFQFSNYRQKINKSLKYLKDVFQKQDWTCQFVHLPNATIPLLTFKVNTSIPFGQDSKNYKFNNKKILQKQTLLSVDITVEPYVNMSDQIPMHFGMESTELVKDWINLYPNYGQLLFLMKVMLKNNHINKMYNGGVSSFTLAVVLAVFYKYRNINNKRSQIHSEQILNCYQLFIQFSQFLDLFQVQKSYMNILLENPIAQKSQLMKKQTIMIINPITSLNLAQRCFLFDEWRQMLRACRNIQKQNLKQWKKMFQIQNAKQQ